MEMSVGYNALHYNTVLILWTPQTTLCQGTTVVLLLITLSYHNESLSLSLSVVGADLRIVIVLVGT